MSLFPVPVVRAARQVPPVERLDWSGFLAQFDWEQGEHISLIGPTGLGKTTLALELLPLRNYVVVLGTKPRDEKLSALTGKGYVLMKDWPEHNDHELRNRILLWPRMEKTTDVKGQQKVVGRALADIFRQGRWAVYVDELRYVSETLKLRGLLELIWQQGRSLGVSLIGGTQRPVHVPLMMFDQATHLFFWRDNDDANLKRIGGIGSLDAATVRASVASLPKHHTLYVNTRTGALIETVVDVGSDSV